MSENYKNTPDNTTLKYSGFSKRLFAYNIDMTILMLPCVAISFFIEDNGVLFMTCFIIVCLYHAAMESSDLQGTFGKKYSKLRVVNGKGDSITFPIALSRILLKFLSLFLLFGGFFIILFRKDRKGLHDIIMNTFVVSED